MRSLALFEGFVLSALHIAAEAVAIRTGSAFKRDQTPRPPRSCASFCIHRRFRKALAIFLSCVAICGPGINQFGSGNKSLLLAPTLVDRIKTPLCAPLRGPDLFTVHHDPHRIGMRTPEHPHRHPTAPLNRHLEAYLAHFAIGHDILTRRKRLQKSGDFVVGRLLFAPIFQTNEKSSSPANRSSSGSAC